MTAQEAIDYLNRLRDEVWNEDSNGYEYAKAIDMAIEALSCSEEPNNSDLISRQDALKVLMRKERDQYNDWKRSGDERSLCAKKAYSSSIFAIYDLPSAEVRTQMSSADCISRQDAIDEIVAWTVNDRPDAEMPTDLIDRIRDLSSAQEKGYIKIPETGIDDVSDGYHTFRQLYYQRMMLFATIVKQNKEKAWKSLRHEDGELCFGGGWFIVGIDTPEGSYTYHYENNFYSMFDCKELERARHWDGHTENDVTRLLSLPSAQPDKDMLHLQREQAYIQGWEDARKGIRLANVPSAQPERKFDAMSVYEQAYKNGLRDAQTERKKGKWKLVTYSGDPDCPRYVCSNCDYSMLFYEMDDDFNFCPNCGADMRGDEE